MEIDVHGKLCGLTLERARERADIREENLEKGDVGTVVLMHQAGAGFEVEFTTLAGETLAVVTVWANAVRPVGDKEIAHVRRVA